MSVRTVGDFLPHRSRDIGPRDVDTYKAAKHKEPHQYGTGYSPKSINNHLAVIRPSLRRRWSARSSVALTQVSTPKNGRARFHTIPRELPDELHRLKLRTEGERLFPHPRGIDAARQQGLEPVVLRVAPEAGIPPISLHGALHTAGSSYGMMGAGQKVIASLLGHLDTSATARYTHVANCTTASLVEERWATLRVKP